MTLDKATRKLLADPIKRRAWVIYQVRMQGHTLAQIAERAGVTRQAIYKVFQTSYPRMEKIIADALGLRPVDIWSERYDADGLPRYRMGRPKKSVSASTQNSTQKHARNGSTVAGDRQRAA